MPEALTNDDQTTNFTDMPVGEILRRTRLHYSQSIDDVEKNIRIRAHLVQAIEENDLEKLPARVYAIGFLRVYAEYLGLDGHKMVELFKGQAGVGTGTGNLPASLSSSTILEDQSAAPFWLVLAATLILLIMIGAWVSAWDSQHTPTQNIPAAPLPQNPKSPKSPPKEPEVSPKKQQETPPTKAPIIPLPHEAALTEKPQPLAAAQQEIQTMTLNMLENSWVEISDRSGKKLISRVLKAGDQYLIPDRPDLLMSLGNAAGVEMRIDGVALKPFGKKAEVVRKIPLDISFIKANYATP